MPGALQGYMRFGIFKLKLSLEVGTAGYIYVYACVYSID